MKAQLELELSTILRPIIQVVAHMVQHIHRCPGRRLHQLILEALGNDPHCLPSASLRSVHSNGCGVLEILRNGEDRLNDAKRGRVEVLLVAGSRALEMQVELIADRLP